MCFCERERKGERKKGGKNEWREKIGYIFLMSLTLFPPFDLFLAISLLLPFFLFL